MAFLSLAHTVMQMLSLIFSCPLLLPTQKPAISGHLYTPLRRF